MLALKLASGYSNGPHDESDTSKNGQEEANSTHTGVEHTCYTWDTSSPGLVL